MMIFVINRITKGVGEFILNEDRTYRSVLFPTIYMWLMKIDSTIILLDG